MTTEQEKTIHDEIKETMQSMEEGTTASAGADEELPEKDAQARSSDRDTLGRFKPKKEEASTAEDDDAVTQAMENGTQAAGKWSPEKPPSSWTPKAREQWKNIPLDIRTEIVRREEAAMLGVRNLNTKYAPVNAFYQALDPFVQEARKQGAIPEQYIANVMTTERVLRTADLPTKFNALLQIADQYGIPLRDIINQSVGAEVVKRPAQQSLALPPELQQELAEMRQWRVNMVSGQVDHDIAQFAAVMDDAGKPKHEFFDDVRETMADLIEMGRAEDMESAYKQAIWMVPEVREVLMGREKSSTQNNRVAQRQVAASKASIPARGQVQVDVDEGDDDDIRSMVAKEFKKASTGRIS